MPTWIAHAGGQATAAASAAAVPSRVRLSTPGGGSGTASAALSPPAGATQQRRRAGRGGGGARRLGQGRPHHRLNLHAAARSKLRGGETSTAVGELAGCVRQQSLRSTGETFNPPADTISDSCIMRPSCDARSTKHERFGGASFSLGNAHFIIVSIICSCANPGEADGRPS